MTIPLSKNAPIFQLHALADDFDEIFRDNIRWTHRVAGTWRSRVLQTHGTPMLYSGLWATSYTAEAMLAILQGAGAGAVDLFRLGESFREPSAGAFGSDALRVISLVPPGAVSKGVRSLLMLRAGAVRGANRSCTAVSAHKAILLSGRNLMAPSYVSIQKLAPGHNVAELLFSNSFKGVWLHEVVSAAKRSGIPIRRLGWGDTLAHIAAEARRGEPILFQIELLISNRVESHVMTAFLSPNGVRFMDQHADILRLMPDGSLAGKLARNKSSQARLIRSACATFCRRQKCSPPSVPPRLWPAPFNTAHLAEAYEEILQWEVSTLRSITSIRKLLAWLSRSSARKPVVSALTTHGKSRQRLAPELKCRQS